MHITDGFDQNNGYGTDEKMFNYENVQYQSNNNAGKVQFEDPYQEGSVLRFTHTIQHGCGNTKNNCNIIAEMTCDTHDHERTNVLNDNNYDKDGQRVQLRNGLNTGTSADPGNVANVPNTFTTNR